MHKLLLVILLLLVTLGLTACGDVQDRVEIITGDTLTYDDVFINLDMDYNYQDYKKEYKDNECIITIRFKK